MPDESGAVVHLLGLEIPKQQYLLYRAILIGPVAGTLIGGVFGVCLAMLYRQEPVERAHVYIDDSLPLMLGGAVFGCLAGVCVLALCRWWPWSISPLTVLVMTLLGAAILAPIGWIAGDRWEERLPRVGMTWGASIGAAGGLALGAVQLFADWFMRRAKQKGTT